MPYRRAPRAPTARAEASASSWSCGEQVRRRLPVPAARLHLLREALRVDRQVDGLHRLVLPQRLVRHAGAPPRSSFDTRWRTNTAPPPHQVGGELSKASDKTDVSIAFGCMYKLDKDTTVKSKVDSDGILTASYKQKISPLTTMCLASQIDTVNLSENKHKFGLQLNITP